MMRVFCRFVIGVFLATVWQFAIPSTAEAACLYNKTDNYLGRDRGNTRLYYDFSTYRHKVWLFS